MGKAIKKHLLALVAASYIAVLVIAALAGKLSFGPIALGELLGQGIGVALIPGVAMIAFGPRAGWIVFVVFTLGLSENQLDWLPPPNA